ncbi:hypothetical protein DPMN_182807, partial [Dreissena polymorpha]
QGQRSAQVATRGDGTTRLLQQFAATNLNVKNPSGELDAYKMDSNPRGWCVIINNQDFYTDPSDRDAQAMPPRMGTLKDAENLTYTFKKLGFVVQRYDNLTADEMMRTLVDASHNVDHSKFDCFVCCILTHGVLNHLYGANSRLISLKELTSCFQTNRCPTLAGKPKLFFLQACQGRDKMEAGEVPERDAPEPFNDVEVDTLPREMLPNEADFLLGYATVPGYVSFRSRNQGSWYIRKLCEYLGKYANKHHLLDILTEVNREVAKADANLDGGRYKQVPAPTFNSVKIAQGLINIKHGIYFLVAAGLWKLDVLRGESSTINMFTAACQQFVKSIGKTTLHATPSLDEKDNVKMFQVVLKSKRRRFIFWEKSVFRPSEFQLTDMMVDRKPLNVKMTTTDLVQEFNRTSKLSLKGKIGAEICKEIIDVELDANDTITLDIKFGSVKKQELGEQDMIDELSDRHINMEHPYVRQIRKDKRNSLCLISGVALLPDGGTIHRVTDEDLEAIAKAAPLKANGSAGVEYVKDRDIRLAKDTAVAYNVQELDIDTNTGAIQLVLTGGKTGGGFRACVGYDEVDAGTGDVSVDFQLDHAREVFAYFLDLDPKTRSEVNKNLLKLMEYPRDVDVIADLLNNIEAGQEVNNSVSDLAKRVVSPREVWQYVLEQAGFSVDDDSLVIPKSKERVSMFGEFFDAATVVEESLLKLLTSLSASNAENMLLVLKSGIQRAPVTVKNIVAEVLSDKTSHKMLEHLKYHLDELGVIAPPAEMPFCIDALYWIVFALYGK